MTKQEQTAILEYIEFHLVKLVEGAETHIHDPDVIGDLYDKAYGVLVDVEHSLDTLTLLQRPVVNKQHRS